MMQEDKYTDFDLQIRSMLQDAEEEVPSRVWEAVSGRIDRKKVIGLWWRRAAAGVAVAAAVAVGVFFALDRPSTAGLDSPLTAEVSEPVQVIENEPVAEALMAEIPAVNRVNVPVSDKSSCKPAAEPATESSAAVPSENVAEDSSSEEMDSVSDSTIDNRRSDEEVRTDEEYRDDPFARMAYEDSQKRSRRGPISGFVQGNVTSNERSGKGLGHMASSSAAPTETGVEEKSISTYGIPLSFGVGAKYSISDKWSVSAAINYSLLSRSFTGTYYDVTTSGAITKSVSADVTNNIHYIGIPVNVYYDILESNKVSFYAFGGFSVEKGITNKYRIHSQPVIHYSESVPGLQWSSALGLGFEFALNDYLGLYIDPSARYYFDCDQPKSVRTQKPFMMNLEVGLRFNI